jgi:hypothetical protein
MTNDALLRAKVAWEVPSASGDTPTRPGTPELTERLAQMIFENVSKQLDESSAPVE